MGLFDNVRNRLGFGNSKNDNRDWDEGEYSEEYYDEQDYGDEGGYDEYYDRPAAMRSFGVDRADYYNDNHSPLVSQSDVRAQTSLGNVSMNGNIKDRIPAPRAYPRSHQAAAGSRQEDDNLAFKTGLARTPNSLAQLHDTRLRMEDSGKLVPLDVRDTRTSTGVLEDQYGTATGTAGRNLGPIRQRAHRRIEQVNPVAYADAEQIVHELKRGAIVVLDLRSTRPDLAKRILDFSFGVASALEGQVERYADRVYLFTNNGAILESERAAIRV